MTSESDAPGIKTEYYYNLPSLRMASPPRMVDMIKTDNARLGKRVIQRGVLITYKNRKAGSVHIAGDFNAWKTIPMQRSAEGVWYHFLAAGTTEPVRYKFLVDRTWTADPLNPERQDDGAGSYVSLVTPGERPESRSATYRFIKPDTVEFRYYNPQALYVAVVGDFNNWNPENDLLRKNRAGFWKLTKRLAPGNYRYQFIVDGAWQPDYYNRKSAGDSLGGVCSMILVK